MVSNSQIYDGAQGPTAQGCLPGSSSFAIDVANEFPQWEDRCDELWEFLAEPYEVLPPRERLIDEAIWLLVGNSEVPF